MEQFCSPLNLNLTTFRVSLPLLLRSVAIIGSPELVGMSRFKKRPPVARAVAAEMPEKQSRPTSADRSAYFARREAAKVLRTVLQGDAKRRAVGSIKSLVYSPSVRNKRGTFALVCETLKCNFFFTPPPIVFLLKLVLGRTRMRTWF